MASPEQHDDDFATDEDRDGRKFVDSSHTPNVQVQVAVTPRQHLLVRVARMLAVRPTARDLAVAADVDFPTTCADLKILARLGVIEWGQTVRVVREPDGFFLCLDTERPCEPDSSRGTLSVANRYAVST